MFIFHGSLVEQMGGLCSSGQHKSLGIGRPGLRPDSVSNQFTLGKSFHLSGLQSYHCYTKTTQLKTPCLFFFFFSLFMLVGGGWWERMLSRLHTEHGA